MLRHRAGLVSAILATVMPVFAADAADSLLATQPDGAVTLQQLFRPASPQPNSAPGIVAETRAAVEAGATYSFSRPGDHRYGLASGAATSSALKLSPTIYIPKTGWQLSGRVGPVRWMRPLEGEGETALRFGGRLPGQPHMPGMGLFNVGIHYTFE